jgi:hypothetical protein
MAKGDGAIEKIGDTTRTEMAHQTTGSSQEYDGSTRPIGCMTYIDTRCRLRNRKQIIQSLAQRG